MTNRIVLQSEGAVLDAALAQLEHQHAARQISGWETGFANLTGALDGIRPGFHLLVGRPGIGKTSFARQLLDQVVMRNHMPGIFFSFAETKDQLRIRTLARLSGLDQREIRRGSAYLLHWYGVPRLAGDDSNELPPTWEKLKRVADEAKTWLDRIYLFECERDFTITAMEGQIAELRAQTGSKELMIVIDDTQRLWPTTDSWDARLQMISEQLQQTARSFNVPVLAVWPDLESGGTLPQIWAEKVPAPDVIVVMQRDSSRTETIDALTEAMVLHVVKNRGSEKGRLNYAFVGAFARFTEVQQNPRPSIDEAVR